METLIQWMRRRRAAVGGIEHARAMNTKRRAGSRPVCPAALTHNIAVKLGDSGLMTAPTAVNPFTGRWTAHSACRRSAGSSRSTPARLRAGAGGPPGRDRSDRGRYGGTGLDNTVAALERSGRLLGAGLERVLRASGSAHQPGHPSDRARHGAAARPPLERDLSERRAVRAADAVHRRGRGVGLTAEQARVLERYHAMFRRAGAGSMRRQSSG